MKMSLWFLATAALFLVACSSQSDQEPEQQGTAAHLPPQQRVMSAIEAQCRLVGGILAPTQQLDGSSIETCQLANGKRCEEGTLLNGACPAG
ncbi:putative hemolysin [Martelella alba]|uniref:DUF333 domain-containing protein n=1 Tax=Martelella alba TaxID=2590451 RepID=A0ABY2SRH6_9HYPH|nr:DUF333 domain-containing protein [Martelella alba]TKI08080.1 DUF333 domain-containing protein [Martelella alba]